MFLIFPFFLDVQAMGYVSEQSRSVWLERSLGKTAAQNSGEEEEEEDEEYEYSCDFMMI